MENSLLFALISFAFVSTVTPGPNNLMLLASGAQYGYRKSLPHMIGIVLGVASLMISTLLGVGALFTVFPVLYTALKVVGIAYLLWLAFKIAIAPTDSLDANPSTNRGPLTWWEGALFQLVNPKAWMMALASVSSFTLPGEQYVESGIAIVVAFAAIGFPCISLWAAVGSKIRRWLGTSFKRRVFNIIMAIITASTLTLLV